MATLQYYYITTLSRCYPALIGWLEWLKYHQYKCVFSGCARLITAPAPRVSSLFVTTHPGPGSVYTMGLTRHWTPATVTVWPVPAEHTAGSTCREDTHIYYTHIWRALLQNALSAIPEKKKWACNAKAKFKDCVFRKELFTYEYIHVCTYLRRARFQNINSELGIGIATSIFWIGA